MKKKQKIIFALAVRYVIIRSRGVIGMDVIRNDEEILNLIKCEKKLLKKPPNPKKTNRDFHTKFNVISTEKSLEFQVFFAQNSRLRDDFSLGLMLDKFQLFRCNGFHGTTIAGFHQHVHHAQIHSHTLTFDDIMNGRDSNPSKIDHLTSEYFDFLSAQRYFLRACGISNYQDYFDFSKLDQFSLFEG